MIDSYVDSLIDLVRRGLGPIGNGVFGWTTRFLMLLLRFLLRFGLSKRCRLSLASPYGRIEFCRQVSDGLCLLSNELFQSCNLSFQKLTTRACCRGGFCLHRHNLPQNQHPLKYQFQAVNMYLRFPTSVTLGRPIVYCISDCNLLSTRLLVGECLVPTFPRFEIPHLFERNSRIWELWQIVSVNGTWNHLCWTLNYSPFPISP